MTRVVIVGAGKGGRALLEMFAGDPTVSILGVTDVNPWAPGIEFARRLKSNVATRATPIVAFTAYGDRWSEAETKAAGCDAFLEKPITAKMLADAVRKALQRTP